jgi:hypothetical protein
MLPTLTLAECKPVSLAQWAVGDLSAVQDVFTSITRALASLVLECCSALQSANRLPVSINGPVNESVTGSVTGRGRPLEVPQDAYHTTFPLEGTFHYCRFSIAAGGRLLERAYSSSS